LTSPGSGPTLALRPALSACPLNGVGGPEEVERDLDSLIDGYFADEKILRAHSGPGPVGDDYDGRLFDWLTEMMISGPPDGPDQAWPIILQLVARAPDDDVLGFIGAGAVEALVDHHAVRFVDRIVEEAARDPRFRRVLGEVWPADHVPDALKELIATSHASNRR